MSLPRSFARRAALLALSLVLWLALGCGSAPKVPLANPSFPLTQLEALDDLARMEREPKPTARPVVVLLGFRDIGRAPAKFTAQLKKVCPGVSVTSVSFFWLGTYPECRDKAIAEVVRNLPASDPVFTPEVDVIGMSMGGLIGRYAAAPAGEGRMADRRLRIHTLYTVGTPHRGAELAKVPTLDALQLGMRSGSPFLARLDAWRDTSYTLVPYVRLDDEVVGEWNAAPPGMTPFWVPTIAGTSSHIDAMADPRIMADLLRRLRGEPPWTRDPATPLPKPGSMPAETEVSR